MNERMNSLTECYCCFFCILFCVSLNFPVFSSHKFVRYFALNWTDDLWVSKCSLHYLLLEWLFSQKQPEQRKIYLNYFTISVCVLLYYAILLC